MTGATGLVKRTFVLFLNGEEGSDTLEKLGS